MNVKYGLQGDFDLKNLDVFFFKEDCNTASHKKTFQMDTLNEFCDIYNEMIKSHYCNLPQCKTPHIYELLRFKQPVSEYVDIDYTIDYHNEPDIDVNEKIDEMINIYLDIRNEIMPNIINKKDLIVLNSTTSSKISLHLINSRHYFSCNSYQGIYMKRIYKRLDEEKSFFNIDNAVYNNNRCMRIIYSSKMGKTATLKIYKPHVYFSPTLKETLIMNIEKKALIDCNDEIIACEYEEIDYNLVPECIVKWISNHSEFEVDELNRLKRKDRTRCFIDSDDTHSTENAFWFIKKFNVFVSCFTHHTKGIKVGTLTLEEMMKYPPEFKYFTHKIERLESLDSYGDFKTIFLKIPMGGGKTYRSIEYGEKFKKVLIITHRITLAQDIKQKYKDYKVYLDREYNGDKQIICVNSLQKVKNLQSYEYVFIDEISSVLKQCSMNSQEMKNSVSLFLNILQDQRKILSVADGNLTKEDIQFIQHVRKDRGIVLYSNLRNQKEVIVQQFEINLFNCIQDIINGKKVLIAWCKTVNDSLKILFEQLTFKRVLVIWRDNKLEEETQLEKWKEYDVVIYSPTISEGVSYEEDYFDMLYVFSTQKSCPPSSVVQMIARARSIKKINLSIDECGLPATKRFFFNEKEIEMWYSSLKHSFDILQFETIDYIKTIIKDDLYKLFVKNILIDVEYFEFEKNVIYKLIDNGYNIVNNYDNIFEMYHMEFLKHFRDTKKKIDKEIFYQDIENFQQVPIVSINDYQKLSSKNRLTKDEKLQKKKYEITNDFNIEEIDCINFKAYKRFKSSFNHLRQMNYYSNGFNNQENIIQQTLKYDFSKVSKSLNDQSWKEIIYQHGFTLKRYYLFYFIKEMGFPRIPCSVGIPLDVFEFNCRVFEEKFSRELHLNIKYLMSKLFNFPIDCENVSSIMSLRFGEFFGLKLKKRRIEQYNQEYVFMTPKFDFLPEKHNNVPNFNIIGLQNNDDLKLFCEENTNIKCEECEEIYKKCEKEQHYLSHQVVCSNCNLKMTREKLLNHNCFCDICQKTFKNLRLHKNRKHNVIEEIMVGQGERDRIEEIQE